MTDLSSSDEHSPDKREDNDRTRPMTDPPPVGKPADQDGAGDAPQDTLMMGAGSGSRHEAPNVGAGGDQSGAPDTLMMGWCYRWHIHQ